MEVVTSEDRREKPLIRNYPKQKQSSSPSNLSLPTGGNGKQIFGDCWWLDTEGEAVINPVLSDQSIQAYLASSHGRPGGSRPLANHLHTPKSIMGSPEAFRHDMAQVPFLGC